MGRDGPVRRYRTLLIAGAGRSGSTIFELMLDQVPGLVAIGELTELWGAGLCRDERCGCGKPFHACPFWVEVGESAFGGWGRVDGERMRALHDGVARNRHLPLLLAARALPSVSRRADEYAANVARVLDAVATVSGCEVVVDASKWPSHAMILRRIDGLDLRMAQLVRDPRGVAHSWARELDRPHAAGSRSEADMPQMRRDPVARSAAHWTAINLGIELVAALGVPRRLVRYEDLVASPLETLAGVLAFAGRAATEDDLGYVTGTTVKLRAGHGIAGNPARFSHGVIELRAADDWRQELTAGRRLVIDAITLPARAPHRLRRARRAPR